MTNKFNLQYLMKNKGFTLIELLVVIAIIGILAGVLTPTLNIAREKGRRVVCIGNLKVIGEAFNMYNIDLGEMPSTPLGGSPLISEATNQIGIAGTPIVPVGLGGFYNAPTSATSDDYINDFSTYACPSSDYLRDPNIIKNNWNGNNDTSSSYIYRAESGNNPGLRLSDSKPAIVMDYNNKTDSKYNHKGEYLDILFRNGNVKGVENPTDVSYTLTLQATSTAEKDRVFRKLCTGVLCGGADNFQ